MSYKQTEFILMDILEKMDLYNPEFYFLEPWFSTSDFFKTKLMLSCSKLTLSDIGGLN